MREVHFSETKQPRIDAKAFAQLEQLARNSERRRARFCLHMDHSDPLQEMVIALCADAYIPPHRQAGKTKSYVTLKGEIGVVYFSDSGAIEEVIRLTSDGNSDAAIIRFPTKQWHTVVCHSEFAIYLEIVSGPYIASETEMAPWAPSESEIPDANQFLHSIRNA